MNSVTFALTAAGLIVLALYIALRRGGYYYSEEEQRLDERASHTPYELYTKENPRTSGN